MQRRVRELFWGLSMGRIVGASTAEKTGVSSNVIGQEREKITATVGVAGSAAGEEVAIGPPSPDGAVKGVEHRFRQEEEDLHVVDASSTVEEVAEEVWKVVKARIEAVERGEVGKVIRRVS